ncbi:MAG: Rpn family recombination-promoting nuclease/putative transposase [Lachnospiraceae bacterium]|nr:Rpn family recombination-promoting nuclease/putative transposase [Lachnospiraceae bacterium]
MLNQNTFSDTVIPIYAKATGKVRYRMTNDYLFRAVFQTNQKALTGLLCSLLHLKPEEIKETTIRNPIELGETLDDKTVVLDISILLNQNRIINLEMQVVNEGNWPERSLTYLCRTFDNLTRGQGYIETMPVIQICFLEFDLFPEHPEFYATYKLQNEKNHHVYSDKFVLSVINLNQTKLATEEDRSNHIDEWAALFRTTEWEEIKMLAQNNEYIQEATNTMYMLSEEERIRQQCEAREEYYRLQRYHKYKEEQAKQLEIHCAELENHCEQLESHCEQLENQREQLENQREQLESHCEQLQAQLSQKDAELIALQKELEQLRNLK